MTVDIDGLDTKKMMPWLGNSILKVEYSYDEWMFEFFGVVEVPAIGNEFSIELSDKQAQDIEDYIVDKYHS